MLSGCKFNYVLKIIYVCAKCSKTYGKCLLINVSQMFKNVSELFQNVSQKFLPGLRCVRMFGLNDPDRCRMLFVDWNVDFRRSYVDKVSTLKWDDEEDVSTFKWVPLENRRRMVGDVPPMTLLTTESKKKNLILKFLKFVWFWNLNACESYIW